jgi:hypothetical protein
LIAAKVEQAYGEPLLKEGFSAGDVAILWREGPTSTTRPPISFDDVRELAAAGLEPRQMVWLADQGIATHYSAAIAKLSWSPGEIKRLWDRGFPIEDAQKYYASGTRLEKMFDLQDAKLPAKEAAPLAALFSVGAVKILLTTKVQKPSGEMAAIPLAYIKDLKERYRDLSAAEIADFFAAGITFDRAKQLMDQTALRGLEPHVVLATAHASIEDIDSFRLLHYLGDQVAEAIKIGIPVQYAQKLGHGNFELARTLWTRKVPYDVMCALWDRGCREPSEFIEFGRIDLEYIKKEVPISGPRALDEQGALLALKRLAPTFTGR